MIEYLILLFFTKYRHGQRSAEAEPDGLEHFGGLDYEPPPKPERKRPDLRIV